MPGKFPDDDAVIESSVLRSMVLFSTLTIASDIWNRIKERKDGRDPSTCEQPEIVIPFLSESAAVLQEMIFQLRLKLIHSSDGDSEYIARLVHRFDGLMTLHRMVRLLQIMHQRLMSLYPDIEIELVEEARILYNKSNWIAEFDVEYLPFLLPSFLDRLMLFTFEVQNKVE